MHAVHGPWSPAGWRRHALLLALLVGHGALFYVLAHTRAPGVISSSPPLFGPVVSAVWQPPRHGLQARGLPAAEEPPATAARHWRFSPIDLWPSTPGLSAVPTGFTPVTDADPLDAPAAPGSQPGQAQWQPHLRMIRWLRPVYPASWAQAGVTSSLLLDLRIDPHGLPVEIRVAQRSGSPRLDESVLRVAPQWRFAWPPFKSPPESLWARVELRLNAAPP